MPPQLEKNHVVPTAWQDEALARDGTKIPQATRCTKEGEKCSNYSTSSPTFVILLFFFPDSESGMGGQQRRERMEK